MTAPKNFQFVSDVRHEYDFILRVELSIFSVGVLMLVALIIISVGGGLRP
ncbi:MAG: hypothetical protein HQL87_04695 [Magnetococcales bacterium]|nr:hypothetical protein [Magnetococcales bacterium]